MLNFLLEEVKSVIGSEGLRWKFVDDDGNVFERSLHFRLMAIIGDTKGADYTVGRFGSHWNTQGLSRDCTMPTKHADDPNHQCSMLCFTEIDAMNDDELSNISMKRLVIMLLESQAILWVLHHMVYVQRHHLRPCMLSCLVL